MSRIHNDYVKLRVARPPHDYVNDGMVRINIEDRKGKKINQKDLVEIEVKKMNSKILRRVYGIKEEYKGHILMDYETRYNDGLWKLEPGWEYLFKITKIHKWHFLKWKDYYWSHPDVAIRMSFKLGLLSVLIAGISLSIAIIAIIIAILPEII